MTTNNDRKIVSFTDNNALHDDKDRKKARQRILSALDMNTTASQYTASMPLDGDNGLHIIDL